MLSQFANGFCTSMLNLPITVFEQINNLRNTSPNDVMECGYE
jgi:hypothetical protein